VFPPEAILGELRRRPETITRQPQMSKNGSVMLVILGII
jgi:hypothetical protein